MTSFRLDTAALLVAGVLAWWALPAEVRAEGSAGPPSLFGTVESGTAVLDADTRQALDTLSEGVGVRSITLVVRRREAVESLKSGRLRIDLPGLTVDLHGQVESGPEREATWVGSEAGTDSWAALRLDEDLIRGLVRSRGNTFEIHALGRGLHAVVARERSITVDDLPPARPGTTRTKELLERALPPELRRRAAIVRVLVAFAGHASEPQDWAKDGIDGANTACADSDAGVRFELAAAVPVPLVEKDLSDCSTLSADLEFLAAGTTPVAREVHDYRDVYAADLVVLATRHPECAGQALTINADAESAFAIVSTAKRPELLTLAHELGHLLGGHHATDVSDPDSQAHGYCKKPEPLQVSLGFGTIMVVEKECRTCILDFCIDAPRIARWSNPKATYGGTATGVAGISDVAHVLRVAGWWAERFRTEGDVVVTPSELTLSPGSVGVVRVEVLQESSPALHVPVLASAGQGELCSVQRWSLTDDQGVVNLPVVGVAAGTTTVEVRAAGVLAIVPVTVQ